MYSISHPEDYSSKMGGRVFMGFCFCRNVFAEGMTHVLHQKITINTILPISFK